MISSLPVKIFTFFNFIFPDYPYQPELILYKTSISGFIFIFRKMKYSVIYIMRVPYVDSQTDLNKSLFYI